MRSMKFWFFKLWWTVTAVSHYIELTGAKPYHAIQAVSEMKKKTSVWIWMPAEPELFIEEQLRNETGS